MFARFLSWPGGYGGEGWYTCVDAYATVLSALDLVPGPGRYAEFFTGYACVACRVGTSCYIIVTTLALLHQNQTVSRVTECCTFVYGATVTAVEVPRMTRISVRTLKWHRAFTVNKSLRVLYAFQYT